MPWGEMVVPGGGIPWGYRNVATNEIVGATEEWPLSYGEVHEAQRIEADAEQAKATGGMVALYPRTDDALAMAVPGGEPVQDMHLTLAYLGQDVSQMHPGNLSMAVSQIAERYTVIDARVMGHAVFNPDGGNADDERKTESCAVYLIGDTDQLGDMRSDVIFAASHELELPKQHCPFIPHVTVGYDMPFNRLTFTGKVLFDRIGLAFGGHTRYYPLLGSTVSEYGN